jgi:hypothetical protein
MYKIPDSPKEPEKPKEPSPIATPTRSSIPEVVEPVQKPTTAPGPSALRDKFEKLSKQEEAPKPAPEPVKASPNPAFAQIQQQINKKLEQIPAPNTQVNLVFDKE